MADPAVTVHQDDRGSLARFLMGCRSKLEESGQAQSTGTGKSELQESATLHGQTFRVTRSRIRPVVRAEVECDGMNAQRGSVWFVL